MSPSQEVLAVMETCIARAMERTQQLWARPSSTTAWAVGHALRSNATSLDGVYPKLRWLWRQLTSVLPTLICPTTTVDGATCLSSISTWLFPLTSRLLSTKRELSPSSIAGELSMAESCLPSKLAMSLFDPCNTQMHSRESLRMRKDLPFSCRSYLKIPFSWRIPFWL